MRAVVSEIAQAEIDGISYAGRLVDEFGQNVRVISAKKYQIYYEVRADVVWVDHVVAGEREQRRAVLGGEG